MLMHKVKLYFYALCNDITKLFFENFYVVIKHLDRCKQGIESFVMKKESVNRRNVTTGMGNR